MEMQRLRTGLSALVSGTAASLTPEQIEEITGYLERRLSDIGAEGDCAYERAMGQFYLQLMSELRGSDQRPRPPL